MKQGELQKVVLMLCEYVLIRSHRELSSTVPSATQQRAGQGRGVILAEVPAARRTEAGGRAALTRAELCPGSLL